MLRIAQTRQKLTIVQAALFLIDRCSAVEFNSVVPRVSLQTPSQFPRAIVRRELVRQILRAHHLTLKHELLKFRRGDLIRDEREDDAAANTQTQTRFVLE